METKMREHFKGSCQLYAMSQNIQAKWTLKSVHGAQKSLVTLKKFVIVQTGTV